MDHIYLRNLRLETLIGTYEWERRVKQTVVLNVELGWDNQRAALEDSLSHALDYDRLSQRIKDCVENSEFYLIEALAEQIAALIQHEFRVPWLRLTLAKPGAIANADEVGITLERSLPTK